MNLNQHKTGKPIKCLNGLSVSATCNLLWLYWWEQKIKQGWKCLRGHWTCVLFWWVCGKTSCLKWKTTGTFSNYSNFSLRMTADEEETMVRL